MRVSARAKDGRQRRPVQHKNRRRARFGVRLVRHPVKVQRRWRAVACWQCTMCVCGELGCCGMDPNHAHQSLVTKRVSQSLIKRMPKLRPTFINRTHTGLAVVVVVVAAAANASAAPTAAAAAAVDRGAAAGACSQQQPQCARRAYDQRKDPSSPSSSSRSRRSTSVTGCRTRGGWIGA